MRITIQRVKEAKVIIEEKEFSYIKYGLLLLVGVGKSDTDKDIDYLVNKIKDMRIFNDDEGKMNLSIKQIDGEILSVPQFTLYADTLRGNRPSFDKAAKGEVAKEIWKKFNGQLEQEGITIKAGQFGANMQVELVNDGPVTICMESKENVL